jgi:hypothetical protein
MNVGIMSEAALFPENEYIMEISFAVKLWRRSMLSYSRSRGRILGRNWDIFIVTSTTDFSSPPPSLLEQKWFETGFFM